MAEFSDGPGQAGGSGRPAGLVLADLVTVDTALQKALTQRESIDDALGISALQDKVTRLRQQKAAADNAADNHADQLRRLNQDAAKLRARRRDDIKGLSAAVDRERRRDLTHDLAVAERRLADVEEAIAGHTAPGGEPGEASAAEAALRSAVAELEDARAEAQRRRRDADTGVGSLREHSAGLRAELPGHLLRRYEQSEADSGAGAAVLAGSVCRACFMGLDPASLSEIHAAPADDPESCPECGTMLITGVAVSGESEG